MSRRHLSDDRLIEICLADPLVPSDEPHLLACESCEARRAELAFTLMDVSERIADEADEHFPAERLAKQQARIMQHIENLGRTARVIAFPAAARSYEPVRPSVRPSPRWFAAAGAVAAAFLVGVLADQLVHDLPGSRWAAPATRMAVHTVDSRVPVRTVAASLSDDELLGQIELAVGSAGPAALRPLDALTPRAWDVR